MLTRATPFDNNVVCQVCKETTKASLVRKRWDGLIVCEQCYEPRHPLDRPNRISPEDTRPAVSTGRETVAQATDTSGWVDTSTSIPTGTFTTNNETL